MRSLYGHTSRSLVYVWHMWCTTEDYQYNRSNEFLVYFILLIAQSPLHEVSHVNASESKVLTNTVTA